MYQGFVHLDTETRAAERVRPPPNSHHKDYEPFLVGNPKENLHLPPSFHLSSSWVHQVSLGELTAARAAASRKVGKNATVTGRGDNPMYIYIYLLYLPMILSRSTLTFTNQLGPGFHAEKKTGRTDGLAGWPVS